MVCRSVCGSFFVVPVVRLSLPPYLLPPPLFLSSSPPLLLFSSPLLLLSSSPPLLLASSGLWRINEISGRWRMHGAPGLWRINELSWLWRINALSGLWRMHDNLVLCEKLMNFVTRRACATSAGAGERHCFRLAAICSIGPSAGPAPYAFERPLFRFCIHA